MSDSEGSDAPTKVPSDPTLTEALRKAVKDLFITDQLENLTVKRIRKATEEQLDLTEDFFKQDPKWNAKSKQVIQEEAEAQHALREGTEESIPSPTAKEPIVRRKQTPKEKAKPKPPKPKAKAPAAEKGTKRSSPEEESKGRKRQKRDESSELSEPSATEQSDRSEFSWSSKESAPQKKASTSVRSRNSWPKRISASAESGSDEPSEGANNAAQEDSHNNVDSPSVEIHKKDLGDLDHAESESEMSVLIDEEPPPKKQQRKSSSSTIPKKSGKAKPEKSSKSKNDSELDPQQAEIKRLQSWLLKCGIRKLWHKELAPYDSPKAKITHLKAMLKDAGMDGRYSTERAKQIKEDREFKADLAAVQEGAKKWGQSGESEDSDSGDKKPKRRLAKGLKVLDFLSDSGGEKTD